jgi:hypothetical protein
MVPASIPNGSAIFKAMNNAKDTLEVLLPRDLTNSFPLNLG